MNKRYGMVIDQERCIGCEAYTVACRIENNCAAGWLGPFAGWPVVPVGATGRC